MVPKTRNTPRNPPQDPIPEDVGYPVLPENLENFLKQTRDRRISLPAPNAPDGPDDANNPWEIANVTQLTRWATEEPDQLMEFLNKLREQRDLGVEAVNQYDQLLETEPSFRIEYQEEKRKRMEAKEESRVLREQITQLNQRLQQQREDTPSSVSIATNTKRSQKLPDPPMFTDGVDPSWEDWSSKMRYKLMVNKDHWADEDGRIGYVLSRLGGDAVKHTYARQNPKTSRPYLLYQDIIDDLTEIYEDPDQENNYDRQYNALLQGTRKFIDFYSEFRRLSAHSDTTEKRLLKDLKDKIAPRLRQAWGTLMVKPTTLKEAKNYLIEVDNEQRAERERKDREAAQGQNKLRPSKQVAFALPSTSKPSFPPRRPSSPIPRQMQADKEERNCYLCHGKDHLAANCSQRPARPSSPYNPNSFQRNSNPRINELDTDTQEEHPQGSDYEDDSEN